MKICQLLHAMTTGGAEVLADRFARAFADRHQVVFACLDGVGELGERLREDGFEVEPLRRGSGIDVGCMRRLARFLKRHRVDLIHAHQYTPFFYAAGARMMGPTCPLVFTEHGRFFPDLPSRKRAIFNRAMLRRGDQVVAVGEHVKQALIENESIAGGRIEVIYNGIDLNPYRQGDRPQRRRTLRRELGIMDDALLVAQVARLDPIKDHRSAVRAIAESVTRRPGLHLMIVGDGPERAAIEGEVKRLGVQDHVHLLGLRRDVPRLLQGSDLVLLTSVSEGIPLTLIEGMACGLPCVSTDVGGVGEVVTDGEQGLLCPAGDVASLAESLDRLAGDDGLRARFGRNGQVVATERFSELEMFERYRRVYERGVGGRQVGSEKAVAG